MVNDAFDVQLTRQAEKDIRDLRPWANRILRALQSLKQNPQRGHALRGSLAGVRSLEFSLPGGAYRAIYVVLEDEVYAWYSSSARMKESTSGLSAVRKPYAAKEPSSGSHQDGCR